LSLAYIGQIRAAKAGFEGGKITWEQSQKETLMNIKKLFYGLLVQKASLDVKKASLENARQRAVQAEANYKNGMIPELRLLNAQVTYENERPEVESAEQALNQQLDTFVFLLGLPVGTKIELVGSIEPAYVKVTSDELLEKYSQRSLDVIALKTKMEVLKCNLDALNFSSYTPALVLDYAYKPTKTFYTDSSKWPDQGALSITLAWNLTNMLPFSANRQKAKDLQDNIAKLEVAMETLSENQKIKVRKAVDTLDQARDQIDSMGRNITLAQRAYDASARSYRNGTTELLDLRDSEKQLNQAKLGQLSQKLNYISALMDLEYTLNTDLSEYKE
jgi:outer membrane protein TolC